MTDGPADRLLVGPINDLFVLEAPIVARLADRVEGFTTIGSSSLIAGSADFTDLLPAAFVEPGPGSPGADDAYDVVYVGQQWSVIVVVRHFRDRVGDSSAARLAGGLALQTVRALAGWTPGDNIEPLAFVGHAEPLAGKGWAGFELTFKTELTL